MWGKEGYDVCDERLVEQRTVRSHCATMYTPTNTQAQFRIGQYAFRRYNPTCASMNEFGFM